MTNEPVCFMCEQRSAEPGSKKCRSCNVLSNATRQIVEHESRLSFTPGEWRYSERDSTVRGSGESLAVVRLVGAETDSNGRLMASAPSLLDFAEQFVHEWESTWVDPDEVNHEWAHLYAEAKDLIRRVRGGHTATKRASE